MRILRVSVAIVVGLALPVTSASAKPRPLKAPASLAATVNGTTLAVSWKKVSGKVQLRVRKTTVKGKAGTTVVVVPGKVGRTDLTVAGRAGAALPAGSITVQARRCKTLRKGKVSGCGRYGARVKPATSSAALPGTGPGGGAPAPAPLGAVGPTIGACPLLPAGHAFNQDVSGFAVDPRSATYLTSIGPERLVHPDFGAADLGAGPGGFGIPYTVVPANEPLVETVFTDFPDESDPGPYPVPLDAPVEGGPDSDGDRHVLVVREGECQLYELYRGFPRDGHWDAAGGAKWSLTTGTGPMRKPGYTSADAAGLPILPGLARYDEVASGVIRHALRFTVSRTQRGYIAPASHFASSSTDASLPPMGLRLRMRADYDLSGMRGQSLVIATALKRYGMIVADNGSDWYISGAPDPRWNDDDLNQLKRVPGSAFEVVSTGEIVRG